MHDFLNDSNLPKAFSALHSYSGPYSRHGYKPQTSLHAHTCHAPAVQEGASRNNALPRDIGMRFGARLRELRKARNMTQLRMAVDFGIDRSFISDVERGKKSISLTFLEVIALGLELELSDLLRGL
ncbi:helix-turn-helix domain-containing protein [Granulicella sp. 5B5]|uniref:helix-turn-helix domain-containing protein n=1 Tax=Granulicella sp. 5B5 TaxID=1617967 RepID=UPI0015F4F51C|nr:helix-turn-helix transcriptional regulator [Granulicella sp. 5B5]QMV19064.1 helix-turn-helix domain-containing protein [Granulicella sp. 5B5]